jgi:hypothetical protein
VEINGENVGVELQWAWTTRDQVQLPVLIGGNPLNQGAVSPTVSVYIMDMWTNVHPKPENRTLHRVRSPRRGSGGMHHCRGYRHTFFLDAGIASGSRSTSSHKVCDSRSLYSKYVALDQSQIPFNFIPARFLTTVWHAYYVPHKGTTHIQKSRSNHTLMLWPALHAHIQNPCMFVTLI